jgi:CubicO group peptidase (beta-lactamase class C family)
MHPDSRSSRARIALACLSSTSLLLCACRAPLEVDIPRAGREIENPGGLSWLSRSALDAFLNLNTLIGSHSGYVAVFARDGRVVHATTSGYADIESRRPMQLDTRFRMASMTKPVTAVAALLLVEEKRLGLDDPVERYIPVAGELRVAASQEYAGDGSLPTVPLSRPLTVRHLLTFTSGIGNEDDPSDLGRLWAERDLYAGTGSLEERVNRILTAPLYEQPGESWRYGWSADVLARVVEVAAAEPFDRFLERRIFTPLGMSSTGFLPSEGERGDMAKMYTQHEKKNLILVDSPASDAVDWTPGGSGLVSTAGDYMRFALMLWNGGTYDGARILSRESVELMKQPHVPSGVLEEEDIEGLGWGLGVAVVVDADATPMIDRNGDFWWSGYYGTTFFVSPETGLVGVVLAQNQPGPFSDRPYAIYLAQAFAFLGL